MRTLVIAFVTIIACAHPRPTWAGKFPSDNRNTKNLVRSIQDLDVLIKRAITDSIEFGSEATALSLLDMTMVEVNKNYESKLTARSVVKVLGEKAKNIVVPSIVYNKSNQDLKVVYAKIMNPDGSVTDFTEHQIERDVILQEDFFIDIKQMTLLPPNIQIGSIIDYQYEIRNKKATIPDQFYDQWMPTKSIATLEAGYIIVAPLDMKLYFFTSDSGKPGFIRGEEGWGSFYWRRTMLRPLHVEPQMQLAREKLGWVGVSTMKDWSDIASWFQTKVDEKIAGSRLSQAHAESLAKGCASLEDSINAICHWVSSKIRYVSLSLGSGALEPRSPDDVIRTSYGDCKDKSTLLISMLRSIGIKAHPALVRLKIFGPVSEDIPGLTEFSHMIVAIEREGGLVWVDPAAEFYPPGELPLIERDVKVLLIREGKPLFYLVPKAGENATGYRNRQNVYRADGCWKYSSVTERFGEAACDRNQFFAGLAKKDRQDFFEKMAADLSPLASVDSFFISGQNEYEPRSQWRVYYSLEDGDSKGGRLEVNPTLLDLAAVKGYLQLFSASKREYPLFTDIAGTFENIICLAIPEGYTVLDNPEDIELSGPCSSFSASWSLTPKDLTLKLVTKHNDDIIRPEQYPEERIFWMKVHQFLNRNIALRQSR